MWLCHIPAVQFRKSLTLSGPSPLKHVTASPAASSWGLNKRIHMAGRGRICVKWLAHKRCSINLPWTSEFYIFNVCYNQSLNKYWFFPLSFLRWAATTELVLVANLLSQLYSFLEGPGHLCKVLGKSLSPALLLSLPRWAALHRALSSFLLNLSFCHF